MDGMVYLGMSGAKEVMLAQQQANNNLANVNTAGFRADIEGFRTQAAYGPGHPSRVFAMAERPGVDFNPGAIVQTGNDLDIALDGAGFFAVQAPDGSEAYTRAGRMMVDANGLLRTQDGLPVLGNGGPIAIPPAETILVGTDGTISMRGIGQDAVTLAQVDRLRLVAPPTAGLVKGDDGLFRQASGEPAEMDASIRVVQGAYEGSNVNAVSMMVELIELQRRFESQVKVMEIAKSNDESAVAMLRIA